MLKITLALMCISLFFYACDKSKSPTEPTDTTPSAEVTNLKATPADSSVTLTWVDPTDTDFGHVEITFTPTVTGITQPVTVPKGTMNNKISGLPNYVTYTFTLKTVDNSGNKSNGINSLAKPKLLITSGSWKCIMTNTTYECFNFEVNNDVIKKNIPVKFPLTNVTIVSYTYDSISITNGTFSYTRGNVPDAGGQITIVGTFLSGTKCTGSASYKEISCHVKDSMQYYWTGHP